jgi:hypothetical protein
LTWLIGIRRAAARRIAQQLNLTCLAAAGLRYRVRQGTLVQDQTVYFAAGRSSQLDGGIYLYGLDVRSGEVRCSQHLEGPDYELGNFDENYALPMGTLPDVLLGDGQRIYMRNIALDNHLQLARSRPDMGFQARTDLLEDSYFKRTPWTAEGEYARLIVRDNRSVYYVRMFDTLRALDPTVFFTPGRQGYLLFSKATAEHQHSWRQRIPVRIRAMLAAEDRLAVAGPPDVVDPQDPLGAFEGRLGGGSYLIDSASGEHKAVHQLDAPPVFNGVAAARGRLYVALENGNIACFAER